MGRERRLEQELVKVDFSFICNICNVLHGEYLLALFLETLEAYQLALDFSLPT